MEFNARQSLDFIKIHAKRNCALKSKQKKLLFRFRLHHENIKVQGTRVEGVISKLFTGKMKSFIKCVNVDYESSRIEDFYDIQLNVKGCKNLTDSFHEYCKVEVLEGDNLYFAEGFGLQVAKKGCVFIEFPPVLHLQLKRFDYDMEMDSFIKVSLDQNGQCKMSNARRS